MRKQRHELRRQSGVTNIVEFGPTMWIVFIMIVFPLLAFGTLGMRYSFVNNAVQYAAEAGSQSLTFLVNQDATHYSATNSVTNVVNKMAASWKGITVNSWTTSIVISPYSGGSITSQTTPLTLAQMQQQSNNLYSCEVAIDASIQPLFPQTYWKNGLGSCPGLSAPIRTKVISRRIFEYPQGLNK